MRITIPQRLVCPITKAIYIDPVKTEVGQTYSRKAIEKWLKDNDTDFTTKLKLNNKTLIPNFQVEKDIDDFIRQHKVEFQTEMLEAAKKDDLEDIEILLSLKINPNYIEDEYGWTPLHYAAANNSHRVITRLVQSGADVEANKAQINEDSNDNDNVTPLLVAIRYGKAVAVRTLLFEANADPNAVSANGKNAAHFAARYDRAELLRFIIAKGVNLDAVTTPCTLTRNASLKDIFLSTIVSGGSTPLHLAAGYGGKDVVSILMESGANPDIKSNSWKTPEEIAIYFEKYENKKLIESLKIERPRILANKISMQSKEIDRLRAENDELRNQMKAIRERYARETQELKEAIRQLQQQQKPLNSTYSPRLNLC